MERKRREGEEGGMKERGWREGKDIYKICLRLPKNNQPIFCRLLKLNIDFMQCNKLDAITQSQYPKKEKKIIEKHWWS